MPPPDFRGTGPLPSQGVKCRFPGRPLSGPVSKKHTLETSALKNCSVPKFGFPSAPLLRRPGTRRARPEGSTPFVNSGCCLLFLSGMATKGGKKEAKPRTFPSRSAETGWTCPRNFGGPGKLASPLTATLGRVLDWCFKCRDTPTPAPWWTPEAADRPRAATGDVSHTSRHCRPGMAYETCVAFPPTVKRFP